MLTRKYGAQLCYTPMMHASVFARDATYRSENFQTCDGDRPLIAQFCSDDPDMFVQAAQLIEDQCDAIDLNLGCPQNIARRGHYGSFLQDEWELIHSICNTFSFIFNLNLAMMTIIVLVSKAVEKLKVPVTAKIRVFDDVNKSVEYAKMVESTGIAVSIRFFFINSILT